MALRQTVSSLHTPPSKVAAEKLAEILRQKSCKKVSVADICRDDIHECVEDAFKYGKVVLAASSYDGGLFTPMYNLFHLLQAKKHTYEDEHINNLGLSV